MRNLPTGLLPAADQARAKADQAIGEMLDELREDLDRGVDPTLEWWSLARGFSTSAHEDLAAGLASALVALAGRTS